MPQPPAPEIIFEKTDAVTIVTLNRPQKLNAMTPEMANALSRFVVECNSDPSTRILILTGAGPKAFCVGSDIQELDTYDTPWVFRNRLDYCDSIRGLRKPIICAINGYCLGGGLELAMVPWNRLVEHARQIATTIAKRAPIAVETAKLNLRAAYSMPLEDAIRYERDLQTICFATEDAKEGRMAFKEKRAPEFRAK